MGFCVFFFAEYFQNFHNYFHNFSGPHGLKKGGVGGLPQREQKKNEILGCKIN